MRFAKPSRVPYELQGECAFGAILTIVGLIVTFLPLHSTALLEAGIAVAVVGAGSLLHAVRVIRFSNENEAELRSTSRNSS